MILFRFNFILGGSDRLYDGTDFQIDNICVSVCARKIGEYTTASKYECMTMQYGSCFNSVTYVARYSVKWKLLLLGFYYTITSFAEPTGAR